MDFLSKIKKQVADFLNILKADLNVESDSIQIKINKTDHDGEFTILVFPLAKMLGLSPQELSVKLNDMFAKHIENKEFSSSPVGGFLNLRMNNEFWINRLNSFVNEDLKQLFLKTNQTVFVEFSSPNTNKPLHLGHIRNILLGWSVSKILERAGNKVIRTQVINDRGIAICKSMVAWQLFGNGVVPETAGIKGDHFVGDYYVRFETEFKAEYTEWQESLIGKNRYEELKRESESSQDFYDRYKNTYFNEVSKLGNLAKVSLLKWERHDPDTLALWNKMNGWVLNGFEVSYKNLGVSFDINYFESKTYTLGREIIREAIEKGIFYQKPDSSVWINLEDVGLDEKLVLRSDGTSVYITQDIGMANMRFNEFKFDKCIYVVADEQDYHFKVLFETIKKLKEPYAEHLYHLSYGMVELPSGKMKSREGTVVDADELIEEVISEARNNSVERGEVSELSKEEQEEIVRKIGMAALKYHIIKVHPKKRMIFDPKESVDLQGHTGPYIQNAYVRIKSIYRKLDTEVIAQSSYQDHIINTEEKELLLQLYDYKNVIQLSANSFDPSLVANFAYNLAKAFHRFYHEHSILKAENESARAFRILLSKSVGNTLQDAMELLGIEMPEQM
ncbi:MAG TPA: arginine--tRNA ligase [Saprospiraceae bacterium]|nr:arginine--tRNA ligase [Saprospiraceae bacterium]